MKTTETTNFSNRLLSILVMIMLFSFSPVYSLDEIKILPADGSEYDTFGNALSIDGNYLVVGAELQNSTTGTAYLFFYDGVNWVQQYKFMADDAHQEDRFGCSVTISGDYVVIGAERDNTGAFTDSGSVYVFYRHQGGTDIWGQQAKIVVASVSNYYLFGGSVSLDGDDLIVGAIGDATYGPYSGAAYIFNRNEGGSNLWGQRAMLLPGEGGQTYDVFGQSVSISGDYALVGAPRDDEVGQDSGSAYIFNRDEGGSNLWGQQAKITATDGDAWDWFGCSVSINGTDVVIGADYDEDNGSWAGAAYVFQFDSSNWIQQAKLLADDGAANDIFGYSVSIYGDYAFVGADSNDENGDNAGAAYIFYRDAGGANHWDQVEKLMASEGDSGDWFGNTVLIGSDYAIAGATRDEENGTNSGSAYIYTLLFATPTPSLTPTITPTVTITPTATQTTTPTPIPVPIPTQSTTGIILLVILVSSGIIIKRR
ncbi:FG-GAP repeat protein [bacterium]|nr:FG-GAP repeat protein [bacterium]